MPLQTDARLCANALLGSGLRDEEGVEIICHHFVLVEQFSNPFSHTALAATGHQLLSQTSEPKPEVGCCKKGKAFIPLQVKEITENRTSAAWSAHPCHFRVSMFSCEQASWCWGGLHPGTPMSATSAAISAQSSPLRPGPAKISFWKGLLQRVEYLSFRTTLCHIYQH